MERRIPSGMLLAAVLAAIPLLSAAEQPPRPDELQAGAADEGNPKDERCGPPEEIGDPPASEPANPATPPPGAPPAPAPRPRCAQDHSAGDSGRRPTPVSPAADTRRASERHAHETAAHSAAQNGARALLGSLAHDAGGPNSPVGGTLPPAGAGPDLHALNQTPGAQSPYEKTLQTGAVPDPGAAPGHDHDLHAMGDAAIAPAPTLVSRAAALTYRSAPLVAQDLAAMRRGLENFQLPPNAAGLASSDAPLGEFVAWAKTAKGDQLPSISYGTLSEGELGRYSPGMLSGGSITLNHSIHDMPADDRAAVLFHELYHYWDNKVARLHYANVSYGFIDPSHMPEHEYDAYYMTALYRQATRGEGGSSRLAQFLDKLPSDPAEVRALVDRTVGKK